MLYDRHYLVIDLVNQNVVTDKIDTCRFKFISMG